MNRLIASSMLIFVMGTCVAQADDEFDKVASWSTPDAESVKKRLDQWLDAQQADELVRAKVDALWNIENADADSAELRLRRCCECLAVLDKRAADLIQLTSDARKSFSPPKIEFPQEKQEKQEDAFVVDNLRLLYGRWLAQHDLYDEAMEQLAPVGIENVVDPAALLFYRSAGHHRLLKKDDCLKEIAKLMENESQIPRRFATVARLMEADIKPLKVDSLDEIARLMDDIKRRLKLARAGTRVRKEEDDVIAKLDKMIEEAEKQQQQQQQQQSGGAGQGQNQSSSPAQDSSNLQGRGEGNVDPRRLGERSDWGNLDPKEQQETLHRLSQQLPAHYREVVEEYFRKLAREGSE